MSATITYADEERLIRDIAGQYASGQCDFFTFLDVVEVLINNIRATL